MSTPYTRTSEARRTPRSARPSTRASSSHNGSFDQQIHDFSSGFFYNCVNCKAAMNTAWRQDPSYPDTLCNDCGRNHMDKFTFIEDTSRTRSTPKFRNSQRTTMYGGGISGVEDDHLEATEDEDTIGSITTDSRHTRETNPQSSMIIVDAPVPCLAMVANLKMVSHVAPSTERAQNSALTSTPILSKEAAQRLSSATEKLPKLNRQAGIIQTEQETIVRMIEEDSHTVAANYAQLQSRYEATVVENSELRADTRQLRKERDASVVRVQKLQARLEQYNRARLSLMMVGSDDDEEHEDQQN
ncbi:uncharacterized protein HMPREF1541_03297 [Cyphellophora europaea CBS 101466]|uniref:GATA-type domain-containing protein n=1 Tax=Cyphellophora europaea (strain CBS 101466) TaxID=1220924 RepID=W2RY56_CYPE1|nr:uncharacterized protein HMPREF1541_03297 [Cyphellophora europaea CBS 101466]ETN41362.1 hypothetical protein HMPREF1541_03297 [Cyphellophora europaea CBS 101466]